MEHVLGDGITLSEDAFSSDLMERGGDKSVIIKVFHVSSASRRKD